MKRDIRSDLMTDDFYRHDEKSLSFCRVHKKKKFAIGRELRCRIDRIDIDEREMMLGI